MLSDKIKAYLNEYISQEVYVQVAVAKGKNKISTNANIIDSTLGGEVPHLGTGDTRVEAPHQFLDGVVVREADLLGLRRGDGVLTGVLHLLNEVLVTLLGKSATLLSVKVDVVGPDLEGTSLEVDIEIRS